MARAKERYQIPPPALLDPPTPATRYTHDCYPIQLLDTAVLPRPRRSSQRQGGTPTQQRPGFPKLRPLRPALPHPLRTTRRKNQRTLKTEQPDYWKRSSRSGFGETKTFASAWRCASNAFAKSSRLNTFAGIVSKGKDSSKEIERSCV